MKCSDIREYAEQNPKYVKARTFGDLTVFKYTSRTHFKNEWNDISLNCRGLVLNEKNELVSYPFTKFFNRDEPMAAVFEDSDEVYAVRKYNGFLAIVDVYNGELLVHTAGSLDNEFCEMIKRYVREDWKDILDPNMTYMFECVAHDNLHVTVENEGLTLIGFREKKIGSPIHFYRSELEPLANRLGCHCAEAFRTTFGEIVEKVKTVSFEGYVIHDVDPNHHKTLKLKSPTFLFKRFLAYMDERQYNKWVVDETVEEEFRGIIEYFRAHKDAILAMDHDERVMLVRRFFENDGKLE